MRGKRTFAMPAARALAQIRRASQRQCNALAEMLPQELKETPEANGSKTSEASQRWTSCHTSIVCTSRRTREGLRESTSILQNRKDRGRGERSTSEPHANLNPPMDICPIDPSTASKDMMRVTFGIFLASSR
jgi:hypothetical protein